MRAKSGMAAYAPLKCWGLSPKGPPAEDSLEQVSSDAPPSQLPPAGCALVWSRVCNRAKRHGKSPECAPRCQGLSLCHLTLSCCARCCSCCAVGRCSAVSAWRGHIAKPSSAISPRGINSRCLWSFPTSTASVPYRKPQLAPPIGPLVTKQSNRRLAQITSSMDDQFPDAWLPTVLRL